MYHQFFGEREGEGGREREREREFHFITVKYLLLLINYMKLSFICNNKKNVQINK